MKDQGLLSRVLIAWPDSKIGSRQISNDPSRIVEETKAKAKLPTFGERIIELPNLELPIHQKTRWAEDFIDKRTMMKNGLGHLRDGNTLHRGIQKLGERGWLVREAGRQVINGANSKTYWRVVRPRAVA
tara:strand:- start:742 stop:1128 length:387 start_codon:yes stop_codon:yes gene_type:complete